MINSLVKDLSKELRKRNAMEAIPQIDNVIAKLLKLKQSKLNEVQNFAAKYGMVLTEPSFNEETKNFNSSSADTKKGDEVVINKTSKIQETIIEDKKPKAVASLEVQDRTNIVNDVQEDSTSDTTIHYVNDVKGYVLGSHVKGNERTYFAMSKSYSHPIVFGKPELTNDVLAFIAEQMPEYTEGIKKDLKSVSYFGNIGNRKAMVHLVDAKREVFEGYIGDYVFVTTSDYLAKGYKPLVTNVASYVMNNGAHNEATSNECSDSMAAEIKSIIAKYKETNKFSKAKLDTNFINQKRKESSKNAESASTVVTESTIEDEIQSAKIIDPVAILQATYTAEEMDLYDAF